MKDNKLDVAATIELVKTEITDDPGTLKIASEISNECAEVTGEKQIIKPFRMKKSYNC